MMQNLKARRCRYKRCRQLFKPRTEWQKFCSGRCRGAATYLENAELAKQAKQALMEKKKRAEEEAATKQEAV